MGEYRIRLRYHGAHPPRPVSATSDDLPGFVLEGDSVQDLQARIVRAIEAFLKFANKPDSDVRYVIVDSKFDDE